MDNTFKIEVLSDGRIKITSEGSFTPETHLAADEFLKMMEELAGGDVETKKLKPEMGGLHSHGSIQHRH